MRDRRKSTARDPKLTTDELDDLARAAAADVGPLVTCCSSQHPLPLSLAALHASFQSACWVTSFWCQLVHVVPCMA